jgi:23S rRNA U2552 (ribose-2'-O)-methylase RlmE/FtsJ
MEPEAEVQPLPWQTVQWYSPVRAPLVDKTTLFVSSDLSDVWEHTFTAEQTQLHALRKRINNYEQGSGHSEWEYYKKMVNPYEFVYTHKKYDDFPDSVCTLHPLSRSYFKIVEMLQVLEFFKLYPSTTRFRSAHVCEGPGGFIEGFLHMASRNRQTVTSATAMTLRPTQTNVPGWKRAAGFLHANRNVKVVYGLDGTGDLLNYDNQNAFVRDCGHKVHFFTGDGGFDFSTDYDSQERAMFPLLVASVRVGMEVLAEGGHFVLKFFDFYHEGTRDLLRFLSTQFREWTLYKPATSRPCNSEHYFLGRGFRAPSAAALAIVRSWTKQMCGPSPRIVSRLLDPRTLPTPFSSLMDALNAAAVRSQIVYLERVFEMIDSDTLEDTGAKLIAHHEQLSYLWCRYFGVPVYAERCRALDAALRARTF